MSDARLIGQSWKTADTFRRFRVPATFSPEFDFGDFALW